MKYIIDIPDEEETMWEGFNGDLFIPITMNKGTRTWVNTDLKMAPYTETDEDEIRQKEAEYGEKAWQLFRNICELDGTECIEAFDTISCRTVLDEMTYSKAKAKYEAWKKQKDEIHVGDEIISVEDDVKAVMLDRTDYESIYVMTENGCVERWKDLGVVKTGRHFPEVAELLKKMRDADED